MSDRPLAYPCTAVPADSAAAKLLGLYPQRQEGLLLQRVRVPFGRLGLGQWRTMARLAGQHTAGYPLHVTTRQDVELHGVRPEDVPAIQRELAAVGLSTVGAGGDSVRNITACPGGGREVPALGAAIEAAAAALPWVRALPRKFKVSLSGCGRACAKPWINDVGFYAEQPGVYRAVVGGSLGAHPRTGLLLPQRLGHREIVPLAMAALRLFQAEGDRANRARARLRHVRERLGDGPFCERLMALLEQEPQVAERPVAPLPAAEEAQLLRTLHLPGGNITAEAALALADAVETVRGELRIGLQHDLTIWGQTSPTLPAGTCPMAQERAVVSCPGSTWCSRGVVDTQEAAARVTASLPEGSGLVVAISGCPNGCAQSAVADIGLVGRVRTIDGERTACYRLLVGGGRGETATLAQEIHDAVPAAKVPAVVEALAAAYGDRVDAFEHFAVQERAALAAAVWAALEGTPR